MKTLELKIPPVVQVLVTAGLMWALAVVFPMRGLVFPASHLLALAIAAPGAVFVLLGVLAFQSAGTTVDPRAPEQSTQLVVSGVYRISRNPMYVGFLLILMAWGVFLSNLVSCAVIPLFVVYLNRFQIVPEERLMRGQFGKAYRQYAAAVRRWL